MNFHIYIYIWLTTLEIYFLNAVGLSQHSGILGNSAFGMFPDRDILCPSSFKSNIYALYKKRITVGLSCAEEKHSFDFTKTCL